jgi:hypothetical protein
MGVDEAWGIQSSLIEDHAQPTLLASSHPQMLLTSTAHQDATNLFIDARAAALAELIDPVSTLLLEWSADRECAEDDPAVWRQASPAWTAQRERMMASAYSWPVSVAMSLVSVPSTSISGPGKTQRRGARQIGGALDCLPHQWGWDHWG